MKLKPRRIHQKTVHDASLMHPTSAYAPYGLVKESKTLVFHADAPKLITGRACRNNVSRAPNKQHRKMRDAQLKLERNPNDSSLRASVAGLKRHLGLLDDKNRDQHRSDARQILKGRYARPRVD